MAHKITPDIARHELAHLAGLTVALALETLFYDTQVTIGFDSATGEGEFAPSIPSVTKSNGDSTEAQRNTWHAAGAIGPIGLMPVDAQLKLFKSGRWADVLKHSLLSESDCRIAAKGMSVLSTDFSIEQLAPTQGYAAMEQALPARLKTLQAILERDGHIPMMPLRDLVPRDSATRIRAIAIKRARQLSLTLNFGKL
jgi:hypothetical protein